MLLSRSALSCSLVAGLLLAGSSLSMAAETPAAPAATPPVAAVAETTLLAPGTPAPDFTATAHNGEKVTLSKLKGKNVVLYWYPKDDTPGCTKQACDIRDNW